MGLARILKNWQALRQPHQVKLWVEEGGSAPIGWYHATNLNDALDIVCSHLVGDMVVCSTLGANLLNELSKIKIRSGMNLWPLRRPLIRGSGPIIQMYDMIERFGGYDD